MDPRESRPSISRDLIRHGEPIRLQDESTRGEKGDKGDKGNAVGQNGVDLAVGQQHLRVHGVAGILPLVVLLLGVALGWLVWSVGTDHRSMTVAFAEVRKERQAQIEELLRSQARMELRYRETLDELAWILSRAPAELETLRRRLQETG